MRDRDSIAELRDKDRVVLTDDALWYSAYAQREREQMEAGFARPMGVRSMFSTPNAGYQRAPRFARPFPARAFLAFCVAGCFAWLGIVAAIRWWLE